MLLGKGEAFGSDTLAGYGHCLQACEKMSWCKKLHVQSPWNVGLLLDTPKLNRLWLPYKYVLGLGNLWHKLKRNGHAIEKRQIYVAWKKKWNILEKHVLHFQFKLYSSAEHNVQNILAGKHSLR
jgi:hypothetical protein